MGLISVDERKRKVRNTVFIALAFLVFIWTIKLSSPQHSILAAYSHHNSTSALSESAPAENIHFNITASTKVAVIIETRFRTNLVPLILHFSTVLGPTWPIVIYTSAEAVGLFSASAALSRYLHSGLIEIRILPQTVLFTNSNSVNEFMTKLWLWESLAPAEHILMFQSDSMICANAARSVDDFFDYDFVGAPIAPHLGVGYNGGLSLRKRSSILKILSIYDWADATSDTDRYEDQWYFARFKQVQEEEAAEGIKPEDEGAINLPSMEIARTFAVETIDFPHPLGVHQVHRWMEDKLASLDEWCPEYKLCSTDYIGNF